MSRPSERHRFSLNDEDVLELARYALIIEKHYGRPMDIEWGKDGSDGQLYILQARPETVKSAGAEARRSTATSSRARGRCWPGPRDRPEDRHRRRCAWCTATAEMDQVQPGDVLVTDMTDPTGSRS